MYRDQAQRDFARTLRNQPTDAEKRLWHFLRGGRVRGQKFRRQAAIGHYIVDFVCFARKLVIELDGPQHLELAAVEHDTQRTQWLTARGFRVLRFRNQELDDDIHAVVAAIEAALTQLGIPPSPTLPAEGREQEGILGE